MKILISFVLLLVVGLLVNAGGLTRGYQPIWDYHKTNCSKKAIRKAAKVKKHAYMAFNKKVRRKVTNLLKVYESLKKRKILPKGLTQEKIAKDIEIANLIIAACDKQEYFAYCKYCAYNYEKDGTHIKGGASSVQMGKVTAFWNPYRDPYAEK